ncbi:MAG TPA: hypothetical protein V6D26_08640 [Stenomitos sp.]
MSTLQVEVKVNVPKRTKSKPKAPPKKVYFLPTNEGELHRLKEGTFTIHFFDNEHIVIKDKYGSFKVPIVIAFEVFAGIKLAPPLNKDSSKWMWCLCQQNFCCL